MPQTPLTSPTQQAPQTLNDWLAQFFQTAPAPLPASQPWTSVPSWPAWPAGSIPSTAQPAWGNDWLLQPSRVWQALQPQPQHDWLRALPALSATQPPGYPMTQQINPQPPLNPVQLMQQCRSNRPEHIQYILDTVLGQGTIAQKEDNIRQLMTAVDPINAHLYNHFEPWDLGCFAIRLARTAAPDVNPDQIHYQVLLGMYGQAALTGIGITSYQDLQRQGVMMVCQRLGMARR
ncbi:MAG: hypothetical protein KC476_11150 [Cyanobacteria bacterium HKST-UBA06]|nr:hypothetical protein [Cyanobacteria bacterium HKST-UBA06]